MADSKFRTALLNKDSSLCHDIISSNINREILISVIHDLLHVSTLVIHNKNITIHPICVVNTLKNFIGDNKDQPSQLILNFAVDYLDSFDFGNNDKSKIYKISDRINKTVFMGDFEDACQIGDWEKAESLLWAIYAASDNSRAALDILAELALQDAPRNAIFVYHILRAFQFQQIKNDNWAYINCIFNLIKFYDLKNVHGAVNFYPDSIKSKIIDKGDIAYFSALDRIWNGEYTRIKGYKREISYWITKIRFNNFSMPILKNNFLSKINKNSFIKLAEKIINKKKTNKQKANELVTLEAIRSMHSSVNKNQLSIIGSRYNEIFK